MIVFDGPASAAWHLFAHAFYPSLKEHDFTPENALHLGMHTALTGIIATFRPLDPIRQTEHFCRYLKMEIELRAILYEIESSADSNIVPSLFEAFESLRPKAPYLDSPAACATLFLPHASIICKSPLAPQDEEPPFAVRAGFLTGYAAALITIGHGYINGTVTDYNLDKLHKKHHWDFVASDLGSPN